MKKVKYNFKKIQEGMINNYGFVELPLQNPVGTAKSNEHDEFVARLSEYKMDPEKVFQAGEFIDALDGHSIHNWGNKPDPSDEVNTENWQTDAYDFATTTIKAYAQNNPNLAAAANDYMEDLNDIDWNAFSHKDVVNSKGWVEDFHEYLKGYPYD